MIAPARPFLERLAAFGEGPLYLVGGAVRDLLAGNEDLRDIDLLLPLHSQDLARRFAEEIGGSFFFLDEERQISRVVKQGAGWTCQFDFTNFEGPDLRSDLARRDFTVNAMALDLREYLSSGSLDGVIDLFGGRGHVRQRLVRAVDPKVLDDDPLRLLRAVRFVATLGYTLDASTAAAITDRASRAAEPAAERVRDELFLILSAKEAASALLLMETLGLLRHLLPELTPLKGFAPGRHHQYDILTHSLRAASYIDAELEGLAAWMPEHAGTVRDHLDEPLEHGIPRHAALRFACLLHDVAKAATCSSDAEGNIHFYGHDQAGADAVRGICSRFRLSRRTGSVVERLVRHHMRPLGLSTPGGPTRRALYRYCRDLKDALPESILLSLADGRATAEVMPEGFTDTRRTAAVILDYYYLRFQRTEQRPLVTGQDLIDRGMSPGPHFRSILEDVRERQAAGTLRNRSEALNYLDAMNC